jgi:IclR family mhp operon transcriptional activator
VEKGVPIRSISRSIAVLQAINKHGSLSMMSIARQGSVPYPTACRIVQTLIMEGLIEQEPARKRYRATALVQSLAHGYQPENAVVDISHEHIREITRQIGWPVSIAAKVGSRMIVLDSTHGESSLTFERYYPGFTLPMLGCASGRLCLAHMEPDERDDVLRWRAIDSEDGGDAILDSVESLNAIREQGYATLGWNRHNLTPGKTSSIAVPIFQNGRFVAALTLIYFAAAMRQDHAIERYLSLMVMKAELISSQLTK